jgi:hypothetical protein
MFGRLNGDVPEQELDLVELATGLVTQTCTGAEDRGVPAFLFRQPRPPSGLPSLPKTALTSLSKPKTIYTEDVTEPRPRSLNDLPKHLRRHALAPDLS